MELLERGEHLAGLAALWREAAGGRGVLVLLGGEAGVGKTSLLRDFLGSLGDSARILWGACDPLTIPRPLGPLHDVAPGLAPATRRLLDESPPYRLFDAVLDDLRSSPLPAVLVVEDVHWSDAATLDWLRHLGRRVDRVRAMVVATFRDDEVARHPDLLAFLADMATSPALRRVHLAPLSRAAVTELAGRHGLDGAALYASTRGNPFFVAEVLATGVACIPRTVSDAVLGRCLRLDDQACAALRMVAVAGTRLAPPLRDELVDVVAAQRGVDAGLLRWEGEALEFRHDIAREAVEQSLAPHVRRALNARILHVLLDADPDDRDHAAVAHHAAAAGDQSVLLEHAPLAAAAASRAGAHRQAARHLERALSCVAPDDLERSADLAERLAGERYMLGDVGGALEASGEALHHLANRGAGERHCILLARTAFVQWWSGDRDGALRSSAASLAALTPAASPSTVARVMSDRTRLLLVLGDIEGMLEPAAAALQALQQVDDPATAAACLVNLGYAETALGREPGAARIEQALSLARTHGLDDEVGRACNNLAHVALWQGRNLAACRRHLAEGLRYTRRRDMDRMVDALRVTELELRTASGDWDRLDADLTALLDRRDVSPRERGSLLVLLGRLLARRGDPRSVATLDQAAVTLGQNFEMQRHHLAAARAEAAWLRGNPATAAAEAGRALLSMPALRLDPWVRGELLVLTARAGRRRHGDEAVPLPFSLELAGRHGDAVRAWEALGCPYDAAVAALGGDDVEAVRNARARLDALGARAAAASASRRLLELGVDDAVVAQPFGLSPREWEVLELVAGGLRNREIAERLFISPKTVERHVSAVFEKIGARSRADVARLLASGALQRERAELD